MSLAKRMAPALAALALGLAAAGCATEQQWCHQVASPQEAQKYSEMCLEEAMIKVRKLTRADEPTNVHREHAKCMRGYGFFPCR
ncbi:MAG: hypothetical protein V1797_19580 [Pseudomonadota bacterium]